MQEHLHLVRRVIWLQDDCMSVLSSMVDMEELLTEILESLDDNLSCNDNMRYLIVRFVNLTSIEGFESHQPQKLIHVHWDLVHDCVNNGDHGEHLAKICLRIVVSIPDSDQCDEHAINASLKLVGLWVLDWIKVLKNHKQN